MVSVIGQIGRSGWRKEGCRRTDDDPREFTHCRVNEPAKMRRGGGGSEQGHGGDHDDDKATNTYIVNSVKRFFDKGGILPCCS